MDSSAIQPKLAVAVVGPPNSGKTTLYNWLTGARFRTVNYPGATVDYSVGDTQSRYGDSFAVVDTPGSYSLFPKSPDEEVTRKALFSSDHLKVKKVIVVVDATQLERQLMLVKQVQAAGFEVVVALTMADILRKENRDLDIQSLSAFLHCGVIPIDGTLGGGINELVDAVRSLSDGDVKERSLEHWSKDELRRVSKQLSDYFSDKTQAKPFRVFENTERLDRFFLNPYFGFLIFAAIMAGLFSSIFWLATPFMDYVDVFFGWLAESSLSAFGGNLLGQFIADGLVASVGAVAIFVPQIFILFLGIGLLEDSGYLARAATLIDKPFSKIGMNGRSFVPLLSGFACAVPAMLATRTIGSRKERWITMLIIPLMTCSARLPVYALLLTFLFAGQAAWKPGIALAGLYIAALFVGAIAAAIISRFVKVTKTSMFMMELPVYRKPLARVVVKNAMSRTMVYIKRAGPVIFTLAVIIWVASTFPNYQESDSKQRLQDSYAGMAGQVIEPVFEPMGADWRVGIGLISAFAAREVFVSSLAVMFNITEDPEDEGVRATLIKKMQNATNRKGEAVFTAASVAGLLVFMMIALQCISTTGMALREMQSWKFAIGQLIALNIVAYVLAVMVVQGLRAMGIS